MTHLNKNCSGPIVTGSALHRLLTLIAARIVSAAAYESGSPIVSRQDDKTYSAGDSHIRTEAIASKLDAPVDRRLGKHDD